APSADGHYFPCYSVDTPVAVCNVTTRIVQRVPITVPSDPAASGTLWSPKLSQDGQRIAYSAIGRAEAIVFDLSTGASKLLRAPHSNELRIINWRDSGDSLLVVYSSAFAEASYMRWTAALLEVANETLTDLKQFDTAPVTVALSHDGRYLASTDRDNLYIANLVSGETLLSGIAESGIREELLWTPKDDG